MKILMRLLIVAVMFCFAAESYAQTYGVKAGLNLSNMLMKDDDETYSDDFKMVPGFHVGPTAEFPLTDAISFETGLLLSTKGFKINEEEGGAEFKTNINLLYLDLPLTAKATYDLNGTKIFGTFGPYIGMGLTGKYKYEMSYEGESESDSESVEWGSDEDSDFKRLDYGLTIGAGVEVKSFIVGVSYGLGLANIAAETEGDYKVNNRVLGISVGYKFGGE